MKICSNCRNVIRDKAEFCDKCGEFIDLSNNKIKYLQKTSKKLNILKENLLKASKSIENPNDNTKWYYEIILSYFIETSNVKEVFDDWGISSLDVGQILQSMKNCAKNEILSEFLTQVNTYFELQKDSINYEKNVIIYTNLNRNLSEDVYFKKILEVYKLEIFDFEDYYDKTPKEFYEKHLMLKYNSKYGDEEFIKNNALNEVNSFFGYLTYINKFNKYTTKFNINKHSLNHNITDLEHNALILTDSKNKIINEAIQIEIINCSKKLKKSNLKLVKDLPIINFNNSDKLKILKNLKEYFALFYTASFERGLENSFIKFWSLSEKIIKDIAGGMKDDKLIKFMEKILKLSKIPEKMRKRIKIIYKKRNNLIHENKHGEITQYDQTLIKAVAENLILFLIEFLNEVDKIEDYGIILDYSNRHVSEKEKIIKLIKLSM